MKRVRSWKPWLAVLLIALLATQIPISAQGSYNIFFPMFVGAWNGYIPVIHVDNTPTPTPTATATHTLVPSATPTKTAVPSPTATNTPIPPGTPPPYSASYYLLTVDGNKMYNLGCQFGTLDKNLTGTRNTIVILDFGSPKQINSEYGTDLFWMGPVTNTQITAAVENFGRGYYVCASTDRGSQIYVGIGTTNYGSVMNSSTTTARALGVAWAQVVNNVNTWYVSNGFSAQVHAVGANDIELNWSSAAIGRAWVDGYDSVNLYDYYDFGALEGCAIRSNPNLATCGNGWTREDAWYKAYGTRPGFPLPEIYNTNGLNAQQWALLSLYSVNYHGYKIEFRGLMTQYQACQQAPGQCEDVDNAPATGWLQLYNELAKDSRTFYSPQWLTDIVWGYTMPAGPLASLLAAPAPTPQPSLPQTVVDRYPQLLAQPGLDKQMKSSLQEKLNDALRLLSDTAAGEVNPASKDPDLAPAAPVVGDSGFPLGIFKDAGGVIHSWEGTLINHWQGTVGSTFEIVSAGASADDPTQGIVMVMRVSGDRTQFTRNIIPSPQKAGALHVVSANGTTLTLAAANGTPFIFDAVTNNFK